MHFCNVPYYFGNQKRFQSFPQRFKKYPQCLWRVSAVQMEDTRTCLEDPLAYFDCIPQHILGDSWNMFRSTCSVFQGFSQHVVRVSLTVPRMPAISFRDDGRKRTSRKGHMAFITPKWFPTKYEKRRRFWEKAKVQDIFFGQQFTEEGKWTEDRRNN